jgi:hypothetical protein
MKKSANKSEVENQPNPAATTMALAAIPMLDPQGLYDDHTMLLGSGWVADENEEDRSTYLKSNGVLRLTCGQDENSEHRLKWELTLHANNASVGYSLIVLRPGDMNGSTVGRLIKEALATSEKEFKVWSDALAEVRSILQA